MDTTINATLFYEVQKARKKINDQYYDMRLAIFSALRDTIPEGKGMTVEEMSKITGLSSTDIGSILREWRRKDPEKVHITKTYVLLNDDGTIDYSRRMTQTRKVNCYRREDLCD